MKGGEVLHMRGAELIEGGWQDKGETDSYGDWPEEDGWEADEEVRGFMEDCCGGTELI